jgi:hypothetical protein
MRLHYYLTNGREFLPDRERHIANSQLEKFGELFLPDFNSRQVGGKILALEKLRIKELLEQEIEWSNSSPFLAALKETTLKCKTDIKDILSITIKEKDSPIAIAQKFLGLFALKLCNPRKKGARGQQQRYYQAPKIDPLRQEIFRIWLERDMAARAERLAAEASVPVTTPATGLDIGDLKPDQAFDTTENTTTCGIHTGNNIYISSGVDTGESVATESLTPLETFVETLAAVNTQQEFWKVVEGRQDEEIKDALLFQDLPHRYQLQAWYEAPVPVSTPATALNIGDLNSDLACDTTESTTKCGSHTGNNIYSSPSVATSDVPTGECVATSPITQPAPKKTVVIPQRLCQAAASVVAAATMAISGLPAAAAPVAPQTPVAPKAPQLVQPHKHHWNELPKPGTLVRWVDDGDDEDTQKLVLRNIESNGQCQVEGLVSGGFKNTHIAQLKPANSE